MAANGGGIKNDEESFDSNKQILIENDDDQHRHVQLIDNNNINNNNNNNNKGISIAERRAAKCGFNASTITADRFRPTRSQPYFTVPPGISPSALLDSPVMLPNVQAQLSPTTGTFQFSSPNDHENGSLKLNLKLGSNGDETMSMESSSLSALRVDNVALEELDLQEMSKGECFDDQVLGLGNKSVEVESGNSKNPMAMMSSRNHQQEHSGSTGTGQERSTHPNNNNNNISKEVGAYKYSEDGFFWRKYGQKHVKGSEFPRSYYKCTNTNCLVRKKVERSHDGQITEIVYRGSHNHPKPHNFKRSSTEMTETVQGTSSRPAETTDWRSPPTSFLNDFPADPLSRSMTTTFEPQFEASPESISVNDDDDDENAEFEPKKRKRDNIPNETAVARSTREPKVVVQIESEIDILDDGYRWRKYGQKVVKGNPNPRSYYKCTTPGCPVRKHVERAANDIKSVITTYEGKHNHQVPSSKTAGSLVINSDVANNNNNNNNNISPNSSNVCTMAHKADDPKLGRQVQDLPVFMDRKPILSYNELIMRSNHHLGSFNLGSTPSSSSAYPVSFPPFNSLPYSSLLMNNNRMKTIYPFSKTYPTVSDYVNHVLGSTTTLAAGNFNYNNNNNTNNNYPAAPLVQTRTSTGGHEMIDCHVVVKPKEEQRDEAAAGVLVYENRLPVPSHGNGSEAYN